MRSGSHGGSGKRSTGEETIDGDAIRAYGLLSWTQLARISMDYVRCNSKDPEEAFHIYSSQSYVETEKSVYERNKERAMSRKYEGQDKPNRIRTQ